MLELDEFDPFEFLGLKWNPDGTLSRPPWPTSDANPDENSGEPVVSKDITLDDDKNTFVRVYRPAGINHNKLPIFMYFHGGGWALFSVRHSINHDYCNNLALDVNAIIIHVEFRLAPEHRLPAQYEDGVDAIEWLSKQFTDPKGEPWIRKYGDPSRFYLYGHGHGGNVIFFCAQRVLGVNIRPLKICGLVMNQPMLGGEDRTRSELRFARDGLVPLPVLDMFWEMALPEWSDKDHWYCNPLVDGPHRDTLRCLPRCLVIGFGMDPMIDRQQALVIMLALAGVQVEASFDDIGFHGIDFVDSARKDVVIGMIKEFIG